jgi:hypothetical protein
VQRVDRRIRSERLSVDGALHAILNAASLEICIVRIGISAVTRFLIRWLTVICQLVVAGPSRWCPNQRSRPCLLVQVSATAAVVAVSRLTAIAVRVLLFGEHNPEMDESRTALCPAHACAGHETVLRRVIVRLRLGVGGRRGVELDICHLTVARLDGRLRDAGVRCTAPGRSQIIDGDAVRRPVEDKLKRPGMRLGRGWDARERHLLEARRADCVRRARHPCGSLTA